MCITVLHIIYVYDIQIIQRRMHLHTHIQTHFRFLSKEGRVGVQLQSISAAHLFHLQKFFSKFETTILDGSKTVPVATVIDGTWLLFSETYNTT